MPSKRQVLEVLPKKTLIKIVKKFDLEIPQRLSVDEHVDGIMGKRSVKLEDIVEVFDKGEAKLVCDELDEDVIEQALANQFDNFSVSSDLKKKIMDLMVERMDQNAGLVARYMDEDEFQSLAFRMLVKQIYEEVREERLV